MVESAAEYGLEAQSETLNIPSWQNPQNHDVSHDFVERISVGFARQHAILAFHANDAPSDDHGVHVAIGSMDSWPKIDVVARILKRPVQPVFAPEDRIPSGQDTATTCK